jgi:hypothetical protein
VRGHAHDDRRSRSAAGPAAAGDRLTGSALRGRHRTAQQRRAG